MEPRPGDDTMAFPRTILVVDDDRDVRNVLTLLLQAEGYRVATAANGRDALDYLNRGGHPDLILLDLMMPVMDGFRFRYAQQQDPDLARIPVVVVSACSEADSLGVTHVPKPVPFEQLLDVVRSKCA
jgi:CheY-like chemotaxis protein